MRKMMIMITTININVFKNDDGKTNDDDNDNY